MRKEAERTAPTIGTQPDAAQGHLHNFADTFVTMQQQRHYADYDSAMRWTRTDTLTLVNITAAAFASWRTIRTEPAAQDFLVTLLLKDR